MGKVRIKTLGVEEVEEKQKQKAKVKKEQKQARKTAKGAHGGERLVAMEPSEEELERQPVDQLTGQQKTDEQETENRKQKTDNRRPRQRGKRYKEALLQVDRQKTYPLPEALELLRKVSASWRIDGTVELHINVIEKGLSGQLTLPHSTGKQTRVAIASDELIEEVQGGKINFDILLAHPSIMGKLAKVAKILGPRGLMPNPKAGTVSDNPEGLALSFAKGQIQFKTEQQAPIIHLSIGKLSMKDDELTDNIRALLTSIGSAKIKNITLKSTMSPGIKVSIQ